MVKKGNRKKNKKKKSGRNKSKNNKKKKMGKKEKGKPKRTGKMKKRKVKKNRKRKSGRNGKKNPRKNHKKQSRNNQNGKPKKKEKNTPKRKNKEKKSRKKQKKSKSGKNARKEKKGKGTRNNTDYMECFKTILNYAKITQRKGNNIEKQIKNVMRKQNDLNNKKAKKGEFKSPYKTLLDAMGGDAKNPKCKGKAVRNTTMDEPKDNLDTLNGCEAAIDGKCKYTIATAVMTTMKECNTSLIKFRKEFEKCYTNTDIKMACKCIMDMDKDAPNKVQKDCDTIQTEQKNIIKKKRECQNEVKKCTKGIVSAVDNVGKCIMGGGGMTCVGVANKTEAEKIVKALIPLRNELENTKLIDALTKLGLQNGKGSDGNKRSIGSRLSQLRSAMFRKERQASNAEGEGCKAVEKELKEFNTSASNGVKGVGKDINNAEITKATKKLKEINSRTKIEKRKRTRKISQERREIAKRTRQKSQEEINQKIIKRKSQGRKKKGSQKEQERLRRER